MLHLRISSAYLLMLLACGIGVGNASAATLATIPDALHGGAQPAASPSLSPEQQLESFVKLAKSDNLATAFRKIKATRNLQPNNPLFSVAYIKSLVAICNLNEGKQKATILNEAIGRMNEIKSLPPFTGQYNPESAYHFMVAIGKLADQVEELNPAATVQLRLYEGSIAQKLIANPAYPDNAKEILAQHLIRAAQAYGKKGEQTFAQDMITEAYHVGFGEFDELLSDEELNNLPDRKAFESHIATLKKAYSAKVKIWSEKVIDEFQPFVFHFNVDDVEGGHLHNATFENEILVIDLWATWCAPCRKGIPHFIRLQKEMAEIGVQVVGISMDNPNDPTSSSETVLSFMKQHGFNYPCGLGTEALKQQIPGDVKYPTTLFVDRLGYVRYVATGYHDYEKISAIAKTLANEEQAVSTPTYSDSHGF